MARPKKDAPIDLSQRHALTAGLIERLSCPEGKAKVFLRDSEVPGLAVRATDKGAKAFVFQRKTKEGSFLSKTIGPPAVWSIEQARTEARKLALTVDQGQDPRELERQQRAEQDAQRQQAKAKALTVGDIWPLYLENGRPKRRDAWKPRYLADLHAMALPGGEPKKRGTGLTRPGPLFPLLALPLSGVTEDALKVWFDREAITGKHQAARALMMFRGFLRWCAAQTEYRALVDRDAGKAPAIVESLPASVRRTDALEAAQVQSWWSGVVQLSNQTASAYLRTLLLTGARREEVAALTWQQVDFRWSKLTLADKVEEVHVIPLTPYLAQLFMRLPRVGAHVFASTGKAGRITDARASHALALRSAGIGHLTFHGLRRSFSLLGEAAGAPAGAIAQIMGHKPSATAEGYRPRSIDALRPFAQRIEAYILDLANVQFEVPQVAARLHIVK